MFHTFTRDCDYLVCHVANQHVSSLVVQEKIVNSSRDETYNLCQVQERGLRARLVRERINLGINFATS